MLTIPTDQEPAPQRGRCFWRAVLPLWIPAASLLHRDVRCQPRSGPARPVDLGPCPGTAHRAAQEHQPAGSCWQAVIQKLKTISTKSLMYVVLNVLQYSNF